jgi:TPP-dependent pyruvate/acetoin dehydrogenase alpha subunit
MVTNGERRSRNAKKKVAAKSLKGDRAVRPNGASSSDHDVLRRMYALMLKCRMLAERAQHLLGGSTPTTDTDFGIGHEAIVVGATLGLGPEDSMVASPRNLPAQIAKGAPLHYLLSQVALDSGIQSVVATQHLSAGAGAFDPFNLGTCLALAHKLEKRRNVVVALCAEERSTSDRWQQGMKFAGIHKLPMVYVLKRHSAFDLDASNRSPLLDDLSFVARDGGVPAIIVDSNDAVAVWRVTQESIHRARNGAGPTLIECEIQAAYSNDPLAQMEHYMKKRGAWDDEWRQDATDRIEAEIAGAVSAVR